MPTAAPEREEQQQVPGSWASPDLPEKEAQRHRLGVISAKAKIMRNSSARSTQDSCLMNLIKAKRRHLVDAAAQSPPAHSLFLIHPLAQFLARLEMRHELSGTCTRSPDFGLRPTRAGLCSARSCEAADLDALALDQALGHCVEDHLHGEFASLATSCE